MKCQTCGKELTHEEVRSNEPGDWICTCCKKVREAVKKTKEQERNNRVPSSPVSNPPNINPLENKIVGLEEQRDKLLEVAEYSLKIVENLPCECDTYNGFTCNKHEWKRKLKNSIEKAKEADTNVNRQD